MSQLLEDFKKEFIPGHTSAAVTWHRDVDFTPVPMDDPSLIKWAAALSLERTGTLEQRLAAVALKWHMDVEEIFYMGDDSIPCPGLLNWGQGETGSTVLVAPVVFGRDCVNGTLAKNELPCKWVSFFGGRKIAYDREKLLFKLCWPTLQTVNGIQAFVGGIAPLALK